MKTKLTLYTYCFCCSWCLPLVTFKRRPPAKGARSHLSSPPQDVRQLLAPVPTQPTWAPAPPWQVAREGAGVDGQRLTEHHGASGLSFLGLSPCYSIVARPYYPAGSPGMWLLLLPSEWPSFWQSHCVSPGSPHARHGDQSCFVSLKLHHTHYLWILPCFLWFNMPNMWKHLWLTFVTFFLMLQRRLLVEQRPWSLRKCFGEHVGNWICCPGLSDTPFWLSIVIRNI